VAERSRRLVVLESTNNHTNLGALVRSAAGLGMDGLLLSPDCVDPLYRRSVRVSMGEVFALPYADASPWPEVLTELRGLGYRTLALTPDPSATALNEVSFGPDDRVAVLLGAEGPGLTPAAFEAVTDRVRIPMAAGVDSLNVAAAGAIAFWEIGRR